jgi:hypothetical protein
VKAADVVVVAVPVVGVDWVMVLAPAVPSTKPTNANVVVRAETMRLPRNCGHGLMRLVA